ncbi:ribose-phosphate diphosphokinase [Opisthorchis viverrini]|uniref:Ribose-phosphate diphosphokinase n=1 Tax=Opisthorchis viverrini TaxID=6198 RepID=A0A1S8WPD1_OPIVI|nr:ribose-phosphate diphosphokinase [Opisthorchis viverrini]
MSGSFGLAAARRRAALFGMGSMHSRGMVILAGNSHPELVSCVCRHLDAQPAKCSVYFRPSRETMVDLGETVRGIPRLCSRSNAFSWMILGIKGFFDVPTDNLRASPFLIKYIETYVLDYRNAVIVARHPGVVPRATSYAERLRLPLVVIHGEERDESERNDGRNSPPLESLQSERKPVEHTGIEILPFMVSKAKPPPTLVGDVNGRIAIIVDDIIDDVEQFVFVFATHGLLSADAPQQLEESRIDEVVVTNTVPHEVQKMQCHKIRTVDISVLLAEAIRRIHNDESMSYLFTNVPQDD